MSAADIAYLSGHERVLVSGVAAAIGYGEPLQADGVEASLYVSDGVLVELLAVVAAVPDQLGPMIVRVVPDEVWPEAARIDSDCEDTGRRLAPRAAVALDLMDSGDPRRWIGAEHLIEAHG